MAERSGEGKTYITLQYLSRLALWVYFRNIKVICRAPVPAEGPLLIAANHSNMVLDPIVLIATFPHSRPCHFWALARFFRIPIAGHILKAAGVLPVDTKTHSNAKLFEHTVQSLDRGAVVALFPEGNKLFLDERRSLYRLFFFFFFYAGTSYTAPNHLPFKDGISWASFEYLSQLADKQQEKQVKIIPVGITYSTKNRWRSEVVVEYGEPIIRTLDDLEEFQKEPKVVVKKLTDEIAKGVESSTINSPDW
jgi:1-acyl-sn-glycerol-3-phosphate acyltransferase